MNEKSFAYSEERASMRPAAQQMVNVQERTELVDSLLHPAAILIRQILTRAGRLEHHLMLIDDEENILQAQAAGINFHSLYFSGGASFSEQWIGRLPPGAQVYEVARRTCKKLFENDKVSRLFAIAHIPATLRLSSLQNSPRDIVVLEDLSISGNIGAIIRTSVAFSMGGVVLLNTEPVDIYDRRLIRASRGYIFSLPVVTATTEEFIRFCNDNGHSLMVMAAHADHLMQDAATLPKRLMIAFGSEKDGCSQTLQDAATLKVQIPTNSRVESLNVSTAAGIMLYNRSWFNQ